MEKFIYEGQIIEYAGFKKEDKFCFYSGQDKETILIYLSAHKVSLLQKA